MSKENVIIDENMASNSLIHPRLNAIECWDELLSGCQTLSCFISRIEKYAGIIKEAMSIEEVEGVFDKFGKDGANQFKGDVTEVFAEYTIKEYSRAWGILEYRPLAKDEQDTGVDGFGISEEGKTITIQIKYGTWATIIDYNRLDTFDFISYFQYNDAIKFVFTLAKEIDYKALNDFYGDLKFISLQKFSGIHISTEEGSSSFYSLKEACNNKPNFWLEFLNEVQK
jgi:hypothetical protein